MNDIARGMSRAKEIKSATARLGDIETKLAIMMAQVNANFNQQGQRQNEMAEILNAVSQLLGAEDVTAKVNENRATAAAATAASQKAEVEAKLASGELVPATTVIEGTIIVNEVIDAQGNVEPPGRLQMDTSHLTPAFKPQFMGKAIGDAIPAGDGKIVIKELYNVVPKAAPAANDNAQAPTPAAGAAAAPATDAQAPDTTPAAPAQA